MNNNDIELSIVYLPTYRYFINNVYQNPYYDSIKDILKDLEMNLIDLNELVFKKESNPYDLFPFGLYGHYNNLAQNFSKTVYKFINK